MSTPFVIICAVETVTLSPSATSSKANPAAHTGRAIRNRLHPLLRAKTAPRSTRLSPRRRTVVANACRAACGECATGVSPEHFDHVVKISRPNMARTVQAQTLSTSLLKHVGTLGPANTGGVAWGARRTKIGRKRS